MLRCCFRRASDAAGVELELGSFGTFEKCSIFATELEESTLLKALAQRTEEASSPAYVDKQANVAQR